MVIDIKSPGTGPGGARGPGRGNSVTESKVAVLPGSGTSQGKADVQLSEEAQTMQRLATELRGGDGVDKARVAAIRDALANNTYRIDPEKIADKLIQFEIDTDR